MKTKIIVSLLLILLIAISASAASANEDISDALTETSDSSDIELTNEDTGNIDTICEDPIEEAAIDDDSNADTVEDAIDDDATIATEEEDAIVDNINADNKKLGDGVITGGNNITVKNLNQFKYIGSDNYDPGTRYLLNDTQFNLTATHTIKRSCIIDGGTIKGENLDYIFEVNSPEDKGPDYLTIENSKFIITKENQNIVFAKGKYVGTNAVLSISGITLKNITFEFEDGIDPSSASLLYLDSMPIENAFTNEINIYENVLNGANTLKILNNKTTEDISYSATDPIYPIVQKHTYIVGNSNIGEYVTEYLVDKAVGDSPIIFQVMLIDENNCILSNKTIHFAVSGNEYTAKTDNNGIATLKLYLSQAKTYDILSWFEGDEEYITTGFVTNSITLSKKVSTLVSKDVSYKVTATKKLTVTFKSPVYEIVETAAGEITSRIKSYKLIKNKKVTFTVNGKTYTATTNDKGVATVTVKLNKKGTYTYTAKFAGDSMYKAVTKQGKLTITPLATSLTLKKYQFKKSAKTKKIKITLKSGKTVLKKQKITLKVKGVTYTAKTNSKGVATVKIKLTKKGTHTYTVKYAGNSKYKAVKKSNKVIIK